MGYSTKNRMGWIPEAYTESAQDFMNSEIKRANKFMQKYNNHCDEKKNLNREYYLEVRRANGNLQRAKGIFEGKGRRNLSGEDADLLSQVDAQLERIFYFFGCDKM